MIARILTSPEREERFRQEESKRLANSFSPQQREAEWINGNGVAPEITAKNIPHIELSASDRAVTQLELVRSHGRLVRF